MFTLPIRCEKAYFAPGLPAPKRAPYRFFLASEKRALITQLRLFRSASFFDSNSRWRIWKWIEKMQQRLRLQSDVRKLILRRAYRRRNKFHIAFHPQANEERSFHCFDFSKPNPLALSSVLYAFLIKLVINYFAPGLPSIRNIFFLYASTPGWSKGFTPLT